MTSCYDTNIGEHYESIHDKVLFAFLIGGGGGGGGGEIILCDCRQTNESLNNWPIKCSFVNLKKDILSYKWRHAILPQMI